MYLIIAFHLETLFNTPDDVLGRKLQDLELLPKKRAPKKPKSHELSELIKESR